MSYTVSLQITSVAQNMLSAMAAGGNCQTAPVQIKHVLSCVVLHTFCRTTPHKENMRNLYWCSLAILTSSHSVYRMLAPMIRNNCKLTAWDKHKKYNKHTLIQRIKTSGSESRGQEEAACMRVLGLCNHYSELFTRMEALKF